MYNFKKFFTYMVVGALVIALSINCKSNEEPEKDNTHSNHPLSGTYKNISGLTATVTTSGGTCNIKGDATANADSSQKDNYEVNITKWYGDDNSSEVIVGVQGEANVISHTGTKYFLVRNTAGVISVFFTKSDGSEYSAIGMERQ